MADIKSENNNGLIEKMKAKRVEQRPDHKEKSTGWARFWKFCAGFFMMLIIAGCVFGAVMTFSAVNPATHAGNRCGFESGLTVAAHAVRGSKPNS